MKYFFLLFIFVYPIFINAQNIEDLEFGTEETLEVLTWNIEQFPKNGNTTISYVTDIIEALDVDILAIQEVNDINAFNELTSNLEDYEGYLESIWFAGLAYIYKSDTIQINELYEIYTSSEYWNYFPRSPMIIDFNYLGENFILVNNHFKCCGDGLLDINNDNDEETRRFYANLLLKEYIETQWEDKQVIVLGDLNDSLTDVNGNNVFQMFIDDASNYLFADYNIASGNPANWSFPNWPSHLDHILITNELFEELEEIDSDIQTIKIEEYLSGGWSEYDTNISDHRPVALKLVTAGNLNSYDFSYQETYFSNYPNPSSSSTTFNFNPLVEPSHLNIYSTNGVQVYSKIINQGKSSVKIDTTPFANGVYIVKLQYKNSVLASKKLVVLK